MRKILIIKTGHTETFHEETSIYPSYGDVLRTSVLLRPYLSDQLFWVSDSKNFPLINKFSHNNLVPLDFNTGEWKNRAYDIVINLEKDQESVEYVKCCTSSEKYGFGANVTVAMNDFFLDRSILWQKKLFQLIHLNWNNEDYCFNYNEGTQNIHDIGLNWKVGKKWPTKSWSDDNWKALYTDLTSIKSVSWQQGFNKLEEYISWIHSCKTLITTDSLGLHLAIAFKKKFVALMGPTSSGEIFSYQRGLFLQTDKTLSCLPCYESTCSIRKNCMSLITPKDVIETLSKVE